jgi:hypothetical protein
MFEVGLLTSCPANLALTTTRDDMQQINTDCACTGHDR